MTRSPDRFKYRRVRSVKAGTWADTYAQFVGMRCTGKRLVHLVVPDVYSSVALCGKAADMRTIFDEAHENVLVCGTCHALAKEDS
jgi:hypothetical protein